MAEILPPDPGAHLLPLGTPQHPGGARSATRRRPLPPSEDPDILDLARALARAAARRDHARDQEERHATRRDLRQVLERAAEPPARSMIRSSSVVPIAPARA